jgi:phosphoribosylformylglycinamidine synthase II/phosphoribosylformylglycinamidine synthase I
MAECYTVLVVPREQEFDVVGKRVAQQAREFGLESVTACTAGKLFFLQGDMDLERVHRISESLLTDPTVERTLVQETMESDHTIDVALRPGVTDTEGESLVGAAHRLGFAEVVQASRANRYFFSTSKPLTTEELVKFAASRLSNEVIEACAVDQPIATPFIKYLEKVAVPELVPLAELDEAGLVELSRTHMLALDSTEMVALQKYFLGLGKEPTRCELETFAQTWSEHCVHKTFRARIDYIEEGRRRTVDGLLPILRQTTEELNLDWIESAFVDNAGIVRFDDKWDIAIKAETHNHPSALEPFGGANTGVGGVIRDILGVSARPFANWDVLCFGPLDSEAPKGSLPPKQVMKGVVEGVADYGNKMGIPTVAGAVVFHPGYLANPLVYCGCLGMVARNGRPCRVGDGDRVVLIGGKTGRDGLGGATFSSLEMNTTTAQECGTAVQIGHPIAEKVASELLLEACRLGLYSAVTDCGAGGLASAIGEMGEKLGALIHLDRVPTKYPGLSPRELWLSEAQERMVLAVPQAQWPELQTLAQSYRTTCVDLGHFGNDGRLQLYYGETMFADLKTDFLHGGIPRKRLEAVWEPPVISDVPVDIDPALALKTLLSDPNICSREPVLRRYDFEVQGGTSVKPLVGQDGPADGVALVPLEVQDQDDPPAVLLGCGLNPWLTELDPRLGTLAAMDEAIRQVVAVGADPTRISLLDNFSWGNPKLPDRLGKLTRSVLACAEGSKLYRAPFVSGKDSLNNEFLESDGSRRAIPGTILISAVGILPQVSQRVTASFKSAGSVIYLVGKEQDALGGSTYLRIFGGSSPDLPKPDQDAPQLYRAYHEAVKAGIVESCHDLSDGGLGVALAECCLGGRLGAVVDTSQASLFGEAPSRLLVTVRPECQAAFLQHMAGHPLRQLGEVTSTSKLTVKGLLELSLQELRESFETDCFEALGGPSGRSKVEQKNFVSVPPMIHGQPQVAVLCAPGINRQEDACRAVKVAGGRPRLVYPERESRFSLKDFSLTILPGGFSFGDDLGAGRLWALTLQPYLDELRRFSEAGGAILGICNGFQSLLKSGLLLGEQEQATLAHNASDHFECRWVDLEVDVQSHCLFTHGLQGTIRCPIAHGEGRFVTSAEQLQVFESQNRLPLSYSGTDYPCNPNGSFSRVAALCNEKGNVMGLMPHPENNIFDWQCDPLEPAPRTGLAIFRNALRNLK